MPADQHGRGGGFFGFGGPDEAQLAALRAALGDEAVEAMQRSLAASRNPRPLTDGERTILCENVAPVLRDLGASGAIIPDIQRDAHDDQGAEVVCAWIRGPDGISGMGISVRPADSAAERVVELAEQLQEWEIEELWSAGRSATWPECPEHPNSHPLEPVIYGENTAVWRCSRSGHVICAVGMLGARG